MSTNPDTPKPALPEPHISAKGSLPALYTADQMRAAIEAAVAEARAVPEDIEAIVACLGDDAATLLDENPECEIAANMLAAAKALEALSATPSPPPAEQPDKQLCAFYSVDTFPALVVAMERHIEKLQAKLPPNDMPATTKTRFA